MSAAMEATTTAKDQNIICMHCGDNLVAGEKSFRPHLSLMWRRQTGRMYSFVGDYADISITSKASVVSQLLVSFGCGVDDG